MANTQGNDLNQQLEDQARRNDTLRPSESGGTLPGDTSEGTGPGNFSRVSGSGPAQAELDDDMEELEEPLGETQVGVLNGEEVGTPAGRPNRGIGRGNNQAEPPDPGRHHESGGAGPKEGSLPHGGNQ